MMKKLFMMGLLMFVTGAVDANERQWQEPGTPCTKAGIGNVRLRDGGGTEGCTAKGWVAIPEKNIDGEKLMHEATKFAETLARAALPAQEVAKIHVVHNKENGAIPYTCHVELATKPMILAGKGGDTPERACYLAIEKVKAISEKAKQ